VPSAVNSLVHVRLFSRLFSRLATHSHLVFTFLPPEFTLRARANSTHTSTQTHATPHRRTHTLHTARHRKDEKQVKGRSHA